MKKKPDAARLDRAPRNTYLKLRSAAEVSLHRHTPRAAKSIHSKEMFMAYDIRLFKLVTGELVIGKYDAEKDSISDAAALQTVPTREGGVQMLMLPYGYPFEQEFCGVISGSFFLYRYKSTPEELQNKYLEAATNLTLSGAGLSKFQAAGAPGGSLLAGMGNLK